MLHDLLDFFSLLVGILALVALFVDPGGKRRQAFLKAGLAISTGVLVAYWSYTSWRSRAEERERSAEVQDKEQLVIDTLCREGEMNYEQLYSETSQGFSDTVLNDAIDDLEQRRKILKKRWIQGRVQDLSAARSVTIRMYYLNPTECGKAPSANP